MEPIHVILGAGGDGAGGIIGLIVLAVFMVVGSLVKGAAKAREEKEAQEREAARRRRPGVGPQGQAEELHVPRPPLLSKAARRAAAAAAAQAAQVAKRPPRRETLGEGVQEELAEFSRHQERGDADRQSRLHLTTAQTAATESQANLSVILPGRAPIHLHGSALAQAVILREILAPPKSLRQEQEMWEL